MTPFVLLTRPDGKNAELHQRLQQAELDVLALPALALEPANFEQVRLPAPYDLVVFVSGFAVDCYFRALKQTDQPMWPKGCRAAAVGLASAKALLQSGIVPPEQIVAPDADSKQDSEALWGELQKRCIRPTRALIVCGDTGRTWLAEQLQQAGASVERYRAYVRQAVSWLPEAIERLAALSQTGRRAIVLLTSRQGADAWLAALQQAGMVGLLRNSDFVVVHERIAQHLLQTMGSSFHGAKPTIIVSKPDDIAMFRSIMTLASP